MHSICTTACMLYVLCSWLARSVGLICMQMHIICTTACMLYVLCSCLVGSVDSSCMHNTCITACMLYVLCSCVIRSVDHSCMHTICVVACMLYVSSSLLAESVGPSNWWARPVGPTQLMSSVTQLQLHAYHLHLCLHAVCVVQLIGKVSWSNQLNNT